MTLKNTFNHIRKQGVGDQHEVQRDQLRKQMNCFIRWSQQTMSKYFLQLDFARNCMVKPNLICFEYNGLHGQPKQYSRKMSRIRRKIWKSIMSNYPLNYPFYLKIIAYRRKYKTQTCENIFNFTIWNTRIFFHFYYSNENFIVIIRGFIWYN